MIAATGAAGKTGRSVLTALAARDVDTRALVRRPEQVSVARAAGATQVLIGDLNRLETWPALLEGVRALYLICPNMSPDELAIGRLAVTAGRSTGLAHLVYHSVLHPQTEKMPHHWQKLRVEEQLLESGLPITVLQPAPYMQNLLAYRAEILDRGRLQLPYPVETRLSLVDLVDVAAAAALVLTGREHVGGTYQLVGTPPLAQTEVAAILSRVLDRPVRAGAIPLEQWQARAREGGLRGYAYEAISAMFRYYAAYGLGGSPAALAALLGREPLDLAAFVARELVS